MNVAFFHDVRLKEYNDIYYTSGGLTNNYLQRYLEIFKEITLCVREEKVQKKEIKKLSLVSGKNVKINGIKKIKIFSLLFGKQRHKIKENIQKSDFIIIRMPSFIGTVAYREVNKSKKKYLIEMVADPFDSFWNHKNYLGKVIAPIMYLINKYCIKKAENVIYVSNEFLQRRYPNKNNNIGCSDVNIEDLSDNVLQARLKKIQRKEKNEIIKIGLIGSLNVKLKGQKIAIKAISKLRKIYNVQLHFLGAGNKENWTRLINKYRVKDVVYFDGTLPSGQKVYEWMDGLDIYIIPSLTEGLPRALIEAMSRGCPCIGSNVGGIPELLDKSRIIKKNDYKGLLNKLIYLIENKEENIKSAKNNFEKSKIFKKEILDRKRSEFINNIIQS